MSSKSKGLEVEVKVEVSPEVEALKVRASKVGIDVSRLLDGGYIDDATALIVAVEGKNRAENLLVETSLPLNRYGRFFNSVVKPLREGTLPRGTEDRENALSLVTLTPERGDDFKSRYAAKDLFSLYAAGFLRPEVSKAIDEIRRRGLGKGKGLKDLPDEIKNPVIALIPETVKKAVGLV